MIVKHKMFTLGEFIDAIEKNGLEQAFDTYFRPENASEKSDVILEDNKIYRRYWKGYDYKKEETVIGSACAMGQGFINLGIRPYPSTTAWWDRFESDVTHLNDGNRYPLKEIAKQMREKYREDLDKQFSGTEFDYTGKVKRIDQ